MTARKDLIENILKNIGLLNESQICESLKIQSETKECLSSILTKNSFIKDRKIDPVIIDLAGILPQKIDDIIIPSDWFSKVPRQFAQLHRVLPIEYKDNCLVLATDDPFNFLATENLEAFLGLKLNLVLTDESNFSIFFRNNYEIKADSFTDLLQDMGVDEAIFLKEEAEDGKVEDDGGPPVIELVSLLIKEAIKRRASDIHLEPFDGKFRVRYRIDGRLQEAQSLPKSLQSSILSRVKLMAGMDIAEKRLPQDGRIKINFFKRQLDLRVSALPAIYGESVVLRLLDRANLFLDIEDLGFSAQDKQVFYKLLQIPYGIILDTGPTGSGKTTTLYASLNRINSPQIKIVTVEDPIEYQLNGVNQVQIKPQIGLTFANVLRSIVRQSPNVIMIGEIRDLETVEIAIHAALTGHLVFSTLHTNDAASAITRLQDMGIKPYLLSSAVQAVLAQRLIRLICPDCKRSYTPTQEELKFFNLKDDAGRIKFYRGEGCDECNGTGYKGRVAIFEILEVTDPIRELILENSPANEIKEEAVKQGMRTLFDSGVEKILSGLTSAEEVLRVISD